MYSGIIHCFVMLQKFNSQDGLPHARVYYNVITELDSQKDCASCSSEIWCLTVKKIFHSL